MEPRPDMYPEYYLIEVKGFEDVTREDVDEWVYFFKKEEIKNSFQSKNIQKTREKLKLLKMSQEERRAYEKYLINLLSERDAIETAKESGRKEGMEEGMQKGISNSLLTVLGKFGPIPVSLEQRISAQTDAETLNRWLGYAASVKSIEEFTGKLCVLCG